MSTSTLIQFLDTTDADGVALGPAICNRRQVETFLAGGVIAAGDWVAFDTTKTGPARVAYVLEAVGVTTKGNGAVIGCALEAAVADARVKVVVSGYHAAASAATATVAGSVLVGPIGTDGRAEIEIPVSTTGKCGIALGAAVANLAPVSVVKTF